jgi:predicted metal-dependent phosphoesterase TrpH
MSSSTAGLQLAADAAIDLHLHTTLSDGSWTLEDLLDHLRQEGFGLGAVTDHDRADTAAVIQEQAQTRTLPLLTGVEMTSAARGEMVDLLCYGFSPGENPLTTLARDLLDRQKENTREVYENLSRQGFTFPGGSLEHLLDQPGLVQALGQLDLLLEQNSINSRAEAEELLTKAGYRYEANPPEAVVEAAHRSGAVCLLAHPGRGNGYLEFDSSLLDEFRQEAPIDGLEAHYPLHSPSQRDMYLEYAGRHDLLVSAGSDSHRPGKPPIQYQAGLCQKLLAALGIQLTVPDKNA